MSALDEYIQHMTQHAPGHATLTRDARAELQRLRAAASEADALRAERDELKAALELGQVNCDAEYDDLRQQLSDECLIAVKLRATVSDQARQIDALKELGNISTCPECGEYTYERDLDQWKECRACAMQSQRDIALSSISEARPLISRFSANTVSDKTRERCRAWLAANAPTPAPEASTAPHFATVQKYREALEQIERVWIDESIADEHIAALKMYTTAAHALNNADDETDSATEAERERTP